MKKIGRFDGEFRFLSNFVGSVTTPHGTRCATVEHAFQAAKTTVATEQQTVLNARSPGQAKREGRAVTLRADWEARKLRIMRTLVTLKFQQNPTLAEALLATGDAELVEGNSWHDNFWGSCSCARCGNSGLNHLGRILMDVRAALR